MVTSNPEPAAVTVRSLLSSRLPYLRPSEQKVALFVLYEGGSLADWNLKELAKRASTSESAVIRMCKSLGFDGFRSFQLQWLRDQVSRKNTAGGESHLFAPALAALQETAELISPATIKKAANALCSAQEVFAYGQGGSGLVAQVAAASLTIVGRMAVALSESQREAPFLPAHKDTVLLVVSHRGENKRILRLTQRCRDQGALSVVITSGIYSGLAKMADILLPTGAPAGKDRRELELIPARVVQLAALQVLVRAVADTLGRTN